MRLCFGCNSTHAKRKSLCDRQSLSGFARHWEEAPKVCQWSPRVDLTPTGKWRALGTPPSSHSAVAPAVPVVALPRMLDTRAFTALGVHTQRRGTKREPREVLGRTTTY